jgi:hypothetical protein
MVSMTTDSKACLQPESPPARLRVASGTHHPVNQLRMHLDHENCQLHTVIVDSKAGHPTHLQQQVTAASTRTAKANDAVSFNSANFLYVCAYL